jgi:hypothetical protein
LNGQLLAHQLEKEGEQEIDINDALQFVAPVPRLLKDVQAM